MILHIFVCFLDVKFSFLLAVHICAILSSRPQQSATDCSISFLGSVTTAAAAVATTTAAAAAATAAAAALLEAPPCFAGFC